MPRRINTSQRTSNSYHVTEGITVTSNPYLEEVETASWTAIAALLPHHSDRRPDSLTIAAEIYR